MSYQIQSRVGAILAADEKKVLLLGYGVYEGDFVPDPAINPTLNIGRPNPRIRLDNGKVVWGCECWWGPEEEVRSAIKGREVEEVDIDAARAGNL